MSLVDRIARVIDPGAFDPAANCNGYGQQMRASAAQAKAREVLDAINAPGTPLAGQTGSAQQIGRPGR